MGSLPSEQTVRDRAKSTKRTAEHALRPALREFRHMIENSRLLVYRSAAKAYLSRSAQAIGRTLSKKAPWRPLGCQGDVPAVVG